MTLGRLDNGQEFSKLEELSQKVCLSLQWLVAERVLLSNCHAKFIPDPRGRRKEPTLSSGFHMHIQNKNKYM